MIIRFKKLVRSAAAPRQGNPRDAGFDLTVTAVEALGESLIRCRFGIAVEIPGGFAGLVFPRSSICKTGLTLTNAVGVIDAGYRGEITAVFRRVAGGSEYQVGERAAQLVIVRVPEVSYQEASELSQSVRGTGGYGSTGK